MFSMLERVETTSRTEWVDISASTMNIGSKSSSRFVVLLLSAIGYRIVSNITVTTAAFVTIFGLRFEYIYSISNRFYNSLNVALLPMLLLSPSGCDWGSSILLDVLTWKPTSECFFSNHHHNLAATTQSS
jgi:hypothetical protein